MKMNKLYLLSSKLGWLALLVALTGCALSSTPEATTAPPATPTPGVTQIPPPATYTPSPTLQAQAAAPSPTSAPPTPTPTITPTPLASPCSFDAGPASQAPASFLDAYVFAEPQVVLTHTESIVIFDWLPDGERLLIARGADPRPPEEYLEVFNVQTGALQRLGEWNMYSVGYTIEPVWLDAEQAIVFGDSANEQWGLYIGRGSGSPAQELVAGLASLHPAVSPDGQRVVFLPQSLANQPQILDVARSQVQNLTFTLPTLPEELAMQLHISRQDPYHMIWHPDGGRIAFYDNVGFYLADLNTGQMCELYLGADWDRKSWAVDAKWSSDGRYLAALTAAGEPVVPFIDLTILDMSTGETRRINLGHEYLYNLSWSPNSRDLVLMAEADRSDPARMSQYDLYLVDAATGDSRQMLAEHIFMFSGAYGMAWSPDGKEIALDCPVAEGATAKGQICLIPVETRP
jgi:Tol biopolymer transport system component